MRHYTQNIDTLERVAGVSDGKIVEAHGTFHSSHCTGCRREYGQQWIKGTPSHHSLGPDPIGGVVSSLQVDD